METKNLVVDLDNTLIKTDYLYESFINYFSKNIFAPFISVFILFRDGRVGLKSFLYSHSDISVENLPYNPEVIEFISSWKKQNSGKVYLISASYSKFIEKVAIFLNCFDGWHGSDHVNLKSTNKLKKIKEVIKNESFAYVGDSYDDIPIWENADHCVLINPSKNLIRKLNKINNSIEVFNKNTNILKEIFKTIRVYQWVKNGLLFVPAILALQPSYVMNLNLISGFFSFSFIASAFYIINDLFDIEHDRNHHSKHKRSFASGNISISTGMLILTLLIILAILISISLPFNFQLCLCIYALSTFLYSKFLKRIPIIDILTLSYLYLLRIISGGILVSISMSNWLLTFSVFFFLFLAAAKRWIELSKSNLKLIYGRGYKATDISFVRQLSYFSGLISVLIICLYIESQQAQALYDSSKLLWVIPIILLYWVLETLFKLERGLVDDDPVKYALRSKTSYIAILSFIIILSLI